jgi:hypothetical protein
LADIFFQPTQVALRAAQIDGVIRDQRVLPNQSLLEFQCFQVGLFRFPRPTAIDYGEIVEGQGQLTLIVGNVGM